MRGSKGGGFSRPSSADIRGNFNMGTWFGEVRCVHGHPVRLFNIGRSHFVACDTCRSFIHVGSNLMSNWRQENDAVWEENRRSIDGYEEVK